MADNAEEQQPEQPHDETVKPNATNEESPSKRATDGDLSYNATPRPGGYIRIGGKQRRFESESKITEPICTCGVQDCREKFMTSRGTGTKDLDTAKMISYSADQHITRSYRLDRTLEIDWSHNGSEDEEDNEKTAIHKDETLEEGKSTFYLIVVLITCLMLLASGREVSKDVLETARQYLECIRDEEGDHPPNVQGVLNHIALKIGDEKEETLA